MESKICFFSKGQDDFLHDIIRTLDKQYETRKITINKQEELKQIEQWMEWADICWFEWCDELLIIASKLKIAQERKIICRLHSYEAFTDYPSQVNWSCVDHVIFVSVGIQEFVTKNFNVNREITSVIPNGVNLDKWTFRQRNCGFKVAYVGYINYKKGPMLLLHTFKALYDHDHRYQFYIAGMFQDPRYSLYFDQMIREFGLEDNFFFENWQDNLDEWLEDKNYILCTSVLESQNMSVMQAMAKGIKPIIHNFVGAKEIYHNGYLWNSIEEAVSMVAEENYDSKEYRTFISDNYSLEKGMNEIKGLLTELISQENKKGNFNYKDYWNQRLTRKFDIEGVGYIGLGEIYNQFLYQNRIDILKGVLSQIFTEINNLRVLELGPGIGIFTELFWSEGVQRYEAVDIAEKSVCELQKGYPDYCFSQGNICEARYYKDNYDLIFAADVLLHLTDENQFQQTIKNISEHLSDNGICILLDPISIINAQSLSPHVVIRDKEYVENILLKNELELIEMLPVAYFMNYPFDRDLLGEKGNMALEVFNIIGEIFSDLFISKDEKLRIGEYLLYKEKQLLYSKGFGLSEKLLIISRRGRKDNLTFNLQEIFDINTIENKIREISQKLSINENQPNESLNKINKLLNNLEEDGEEVIIEEIIQRMNEFISYDIIDFDKYDFTTAQIMLGKREKVGNRYELLEFILNNDQKNKLIFNNIWYDHIKNILILPAQMQKSIKSREILYIAQELFCCELEFQNNLAGFIFDESIQEDVRLNSSAYIWERGIPASQFMPLAGYMKIAGRYAFAAGFLNKNYKVLEAPCGFGYGAAYFAKKCREVEALDIAEENIRFAKEAFRHDNVNWNKGDVMKLPFRDNEFDVYVSYEVFEHLPIETAIQHIKEACRVIKVSGKFIISTPNRETRKNIRNPFHTKEYDYKEFKYILNQVFNKVEFYSMSGYQVEEGMKETAYIMIAVCEK